MEPAREASAADQAKRALRASMKRLLASLSDAELAERGAGVARLLAAAPTWRAADTVLCFLSMPHELDTAPVIRAAAAAGKRVAVPLITGNDIVFTLLDADPGALPRDRWGIPVPDPRWPALDLGAAGTLLVAAPGLAFDRAGNRLGRGRGYYDRFLASARGRAAGLAVVGVCAAEQLVIDVPHAASDVAMDAVVTDRELIDCHPHPS
jgi:5-formyltetrahydrofolate cyclo-ligase